MNRLATYLTVCLVLLGGQFSASPARAADCCTPSGLPGCDDPFVMMCVCMLDINCCIAWDATCVSEVTLLGCGSCGGCISNCAGKQCGDDGCGGTCGQCFGNNICQNGNCIPSCTPNCAAKQCGSDGCTGTCGTCQINYTCVNGVCQANCQPQCGGKQCGPDGCNGTCGNCGFGDICNNGFCEAACEPQCTGKQCGSNSCGGMCGSCGFTEMCNATGQCVPQCPKDCLGKECGDDGCGGSCGDCPNGDVCSDGLCLPPCQPTCINKECGSDGCGGLCGSCGDGTVCVVPGICLPEDEAEGQVLDEADSYEYNGSGVGADVQANVGPVSCPSGYVLLYGICVLDEETAEEDGDASGNCSAGEQRSPAGALLLLLLLGLLLYGTGARNRTCRMAPFTRHA